MSIIGNLVNMLKHMGVIAGTDREVGHDDQKLIDLVNKHKWSQHIFSNP